MVLWKGMILAALLGPLTGSLDWFPLLVPFTGSLYWFVDLNVATAAGTSSSLGRISGTGPTGVILYIPPKKKISMYP